MPTAEPTKLCPHCRQEILAAAQKCRFCRQWLTAPLAPAETAFSERPTPVAEGDFANLTAPSPDDLVRGAYANCPWCRCPGRADRVSFTWWGGLVGPAILCHVKCRNCRKCYNGRSGKTNDTAIAIYFGVGLVIGLAVFLMSCVLSASVSR